MSCPSSSSTHWGTESWGPVPSVGLSQQESRGDRYAVLLPYRNVPSPAVPETWEDEKHSPQEFGEKKIEGHKANANLVIQCKLCQADPVHQAANSWAGLGAYLWLLLRAHVPSKKKPAHPQVALATRYPSWDKNLAKWSKHGQSYDGLFLAPPLFIPCWWPFVRLHLIIALNQKKNNFLSRFLKPR